MAATTCQRGEIRTSQLSKQLPEILSNSPPSSLLEYFTQYMESVDALPLVQFWLSVESFKATAAERGHGGESSLSSMKICQEIVEQKELLNYCGLDHHGVTLVAPQPSQHCPARMKKDGLSDLSCPCSSNGVEVARGTSQVLAGTGSDRAIVQGEVDCTAWAAPGHWGMSTASGSDFSNVCTTLIQDLDSPPVVLERNFSQQKFPTLVTEAISIYTTYVALNALSPVGVPDVVRQKLEVSICPEDGVIDRCCFDEAQSFVFSTMEKRHYHGFLGSHFLCKYQLEYVTSGNLKLLDFLMGQNTLFYFMEYMEQEGASSILQFWLTAESFHAHMTSPFRVPDIQTDTADAIAVYERYFSLQASEPLDMEDTVRLDIENKICDENGPRADSFTVAQQSAYNIMNQTYYPHFLESSIYLRFLDELLHMLRTGGSRRPSTVAVSESSSADLAPGCDVEDPEALWQRATRPMRLGFVDEFGQYVSEIDPSPPKSGKLQVTGAHTASRKRQRLWLRRKKVDEELAMRIARGIVVEVLESVSIPSAQSTDRGQLPHLPTLDCGAVAIIS